MNINEIATKQDILAVLHKLNDLMETVERLKTTSGAKKDNTYLTGKEVMEKLRISKSHLNDLRIEGKIPYVKTCGVIRYPAAEIERMLSKYFNPRCD